MENQNLDSLRHSASHILAAAVRKLYPNVKFAIGPAIADGFYYDFEFEKPLQEEELAKIETEMAKIIKADLPIEKSVKSKTEAQKILKDQPFKLELLEEIEKPSFYKIGDFIDLCAGPHVKSTGEVKAIKLLSLAGAYWRGSEKNKMLTRIYGTAFPDQSALEDYLKLLEKAKKRDHKKLGRELELFFFDETAPGMAYWLPKGLKVYNLLLDFWRTEHEIRGYQEIKSPLLNKKILYEISGHWDHYRDDMFISNNNENETYALKPMNCPNAMVVFAMKKRSYHELPLRLSDCDTLHRNELSGALNGLLRIRSFSQDDAHIFIRPSQIEQEYKNILEIVEKFYSIFGLEYSFRLSTRPDDFMGDLETWNKAESILKDLLEKSGKKFHIEAGDGAFYGPKIDILMKDSLGREWQMGTMQLDFQIPRNFKLTYTNEKGEEAIPVVIHRVIYGSLERFIGILTEHYAGAFPLWLAPVQVKVLPISDKFTDYSKTIFDKLKQKNIRVELDDRSETLGSRIRDGQLTKVPYLVIIGAKEQSSGKVAIRSREKGDLGQMELEKFQAMLED